MIKLHRTEHSTGIDHNKTDKSKRNKICYYNYFNNGFKSHSKLCIEFDPRMKFLGNFA